MAGRPRCAHCHKAFTPNSRNRTRTKDRQRVCGDCGRAIGHRLAAKRYRDSLAALERKPLKARAAKAQSAPPVQARAVGRLAERSDEFKTPAAGFGLAGRVGVHLAAIAALVGDPSAA